jgi:hypothetical protein
VEDHIADELRQFDQQLGIQTAGEDDDDVVMEAGSILVNEKCPLTLTPVSAVCASRQQPGAAWARCFGNPVLFCHAFLRCNNS